MRKRILTLLFLISIFILSSCSFVENIKVIKDYSGNEADERIEQLVEALENDNKDEVKSIFSKKALNDAEGFDNSLEQLFDYFQGNVEEWERVRYSGGSSVRNGKKSEYSESWYKVETDLESYMFFLIDYTTDTINPDNQGLYTLRVIKAEDEDTEFGSVQDMTIPGIYIPKE